jgi:hypothetical protein
MGVSRPVGRVLCARLLRGGGHPSRTAVADSLLRSTREHRAGHPRSLTQGTVVPLLTLLRVGFTEPPQSPAALVVSYTAVSPLPCAWDAGRSVFCGTVPRVTPGRRYRPPCPVEPGPSSPGLRPARPPGRLTRPKDTPPGGPAQLTGPGTWRVSSSCCPSSCRGAGGWGVGRTRIGAKARPAASEAKGSTGSRYR